MAQMVRNSPSMWKSWVQSLGWEDPLGEGRATHSSILAWRIPMERGIWLVTVHRVTKSPTPLRSTAQHSTHIVALIYDLQRALLSFSSQGSSLRIHWKA